MVDLYSFFGQLLHNPLDESSISHQPSDMVNHEIVGRCPYRMMQGVK